MTLHLLCSVPCFIFRFVQKKKKERKKTGDQTLCMEKHDDRSFLK